VIYRILRPLARLASLIYFRKIFLLNVEAVPKEGPLLIVCNHPSAFLEACLLAVLLPRPLHFLTRGDFFKNRFFNWFLRQTHQIPIFRSKDGFEKLRNNPDTFAFCFQALKEEKAILIFPESWTVLEKRLRPLQKGAARLALGALSHVSSLNILPVGVTFSDPTKFRDLVTVKCGTPIPIHRPIHPADERMLITEITDKIEVDLRELMIHIERPEREPVFDALQQLRFTDQRLAGLPAISRVPDFPEEEVRLEKKINALSDPEGDLLADKINAYALELKRHGLVDRHFTNNARRSALCRILLIPGTLVFLAGKVISALPAWLTLQFLNSKVTNLPFYGPLKWVLGFFIFVLWYGICLLAGYLAGGITGMLVALIWLLLGYVTLLYFHDLGVRGFLAPLTMSGESRKQLAEMRKSINDTLS
jgi:1-acyl-sn-glycerol-3-phosphate acyltransferase